jgi:sn-glycerol 3-phosphate transport system ATP-binding protein
VEYLGADALVTCMVGDRPIVVRSKGALAPQRGAVSLRWDASAIHLFDAADGRRVASGDAVSPSVPAEEQSGRILA